MTTNTYQALCDRVGLKPRYFAIFWDYEPDSRCEFVNEKEYKTLEEAIKRSSSEFKNQVEPRLPYQSAEQREKLLILIEKQVGLTAIYLKETNDYIMRDETFSFEYVSITGERDECLYGITQKLVDEGVLSKGEVKEALSGNK